MTAVDEFSALTQSIGEHAVSAIGSEHLRELSVVLSGTDMTARIVVSLRENTQAEQDYALEELFNVQELFFDEVSMTFGFGTETELANAESTARRQFSFA